MSKLYTIVYRTTGEDVQQVCVIKDNDARTPALALAAFQEAHPHALLMAIIDQDLLVVLPSLQQSLSAQIQLIADASNEQELASPASISVTYGNGGEFMICGETGKVLTPPTEMEEPFNQYESADIQEYLQWARSAGLSYPTSICALGLTWIHRNGYVEPAETDWRDDLLEENGLARPINQPMDRLAWESEVFHQISVQGEMTNGDAQAITEAQQGRFDGFFELKIHPAAAARQLLLQTV